MNFNAPLLRPIRILLFPFSLLYACIVYLRNLFFNKHWFHETFFNLPVICVGNIAVGGTGKSTMVEYLLDFLKHKHHPAVLSRGYKRKTKGYALANTKSTALEIGDEPMQFYNKYPSLAIAVGEKRVEAIPQLLQDRPDTDVIILDDAFQHRAVKAGLNIILTEFNNLYTRDWFLPTGDLRDQRSSSSRADLIVVTKSPANLEHHLAASIIEELEPLPHQTVFFSSLKYGIPYHIISKDQLPILAEQEILLVTGIANPAPLKSFIHEKAHTYEEMLYNDHHIYTIDDWNDIIKRFEAMSSSQKILITTEKDAVRLVKFAHHLTNIPFYVIPIQMELLFDQENLFKNKVLSYVESQPKGLF